MPGFGKIIKAIEGDTKIRKLEKLGDYETARRLRTNLLNKYEIKYLGPLWRSEGMDQLYNLKNYEKALEAFENAISCIKGRASISAMQYGVTQPIQAYYGAAAAAIHISDIQKAEVYFLDFCELVERMNVKDQYQDQHNWLKKKSKI